MSRSPVAFLVAVGLVLVASGCHRDHPTSTGVTSVSTAPTSTTTVPAGPLTLLTADRPVGRFDVAVPTGFGYVDLTVSTVDNPGKEAVSVVLAADVGAKEPLAIGTVSLYPASNPGAFRLLVPAPVIAALRGRPRVHLVVTLSGERERGLAGVRLTIVAPAFSNG